MAEISDSIKFEKVTLFISTQTYMANGAGTGLDNIMDVLNEHLDADCKVLDYQVEDYKLIAAPTATD